MATWAAPTQAYRLSRPAIVLGVRRDRRQPTIDGWVRTGLPCRDLEVPGARYFLKEGILASRADFVAMVCEQMRGAGDVSARKMFGEYAIYCGGKVVALVCDDQLFLKPTPAGRALLGSPVEGLPYPGAKPHFLIIDELDDSERLARLVTITAQSLPAAKPKTKRTK